MALIVVIVGTHDDEEECTATSSVNQSVWIMTMKMADRE
jgi:hypothetical protein